MGSSVYKPGPVAPQMNITPLIDVVFLLIVFFMLVNTLAGGDTVPMRLPELDEAQTRALSEEGRLVVNIVPQPEPDQATRAADPLGHAGVPSRVQVGSATTLGMDELIGVTAAVERALQQNPELQILLRADAALHYEQIEPVLEAVRAAGARRVSLVAYLPEAETGE